MRGVCFLSAIAILASACRPTPSSGLDHTFERTRREPKAALEPCRTESTANPVLQKADQYLTAIAMFIMERNPKTFKDVYAPDKFCVSVRHNTAVNAYALAASREVIFFSGFLEVMATDAHAAAVMAHELAHVTMQHQEDLEADEVERNEQWQKKGPALKRRLAELASDQGELDKTQEALYREQESIEAAFDAAQTQDIKTARAEVESLFTAIQAEFLPILSSGRDDYFAFLSLSMQMELPTPRHSLDYTPSDGALSTSDAPEYKTIRDKVNVYRSKRAALIAAEEKASPALAERYRMLLARSSELDRGYASVYANREHIAEELHDLRMAAMGAEAENWKEEEADDVGLELYLRAGLAPMSYLGLFEVLRAQDQQDAAACAIQTENAQPDRGTGSHPNPCWRYYNAKVLEMNEHAADYAPFMATAVQTSIVPGELEKLKRSIAALKEEETP